MKGDKHHSVPKLMNCHLDLAGAENRQTDLIHPNGRDWQESELITSS